MNRADLTRRAPDLEVAVVGAGVAGLAAAAELARAGSEVAVFEASQRAGGAAWSEARAGFLVERGATTFRIGVAADRFLREQGLDQRLVAASPASRERFLVRAGRLVPVPLSPLAFATSELLSVRGKLRLLAEPLVRAGDATGESVADFTTRRLGAEACRRLVAPFLIGVYAGDEAQLGAEPVFPSLVEAERRHGSIARGLLARSLRGGARGRAGSWSWRGGLGALAEALAARLGAALRLCSRVSRIAFEEGVYRLEIEGESGSTRVAARRLVLATPAREAAALVTPLDLEAAKVLDSIAYAPIASLSIGVEASARIRGFGFLVPDAESEALLGCLFASELFAGRAPPGRALLTALFGGLRRPAAVDWPEDRLLGALAPELDRLLGVQGTPERLAITRWPRGVAQPGCQQPRRVADARARLARYPGLALAGAHLDGVAFGDALASGASAARRILEVR